MRTVGVLLLGAGRISEESEMLQSNRRAGNGGYYGVALAAAAAAAAAMFLMDPRSGRRRRALLRDQVSRTAHQTQEFVGKASRDARQRIRGVYSEQASRFRNAGSADDVIAERVRAALGRLTSHPGPIYVTSMNGVVRLRGDVLQKEAATVLQGVARVRGVRNVVNELRAHREAGRISALQGAGTPRSHARFEYLQTNWSPAPRLFAGAAGFALVLAGVARRTPLSYGLAACGAALLTRSITNTPLTHLAGVHASDADGVHVQKTIEVYAEVDEVYECWRDLECFPRFMSHIREVQKLDDTHYRWTVDGPAGMPIAWDAEITADVPGELIAWRTINSKIVQSTGVVHFEPTTSGGTRVHVRMTYRPLANRIGHTLAKMFARDPKHQLDEDLMRFKGYMESSGPSLDVSQMSTAHEQYGREHYGPIQH
jgi:uncharacterized membrane protein/osmotically-inducible protein OsmY